jgi:hypothetical protein
MPIMASPYSPKPVDVPDALVDRFRAAGFNEQEPEEVNVDESTEAPAPRRGRPRKRS